MNFLIKNFLRGLAIVVPAAVTIWVLYVTFVWIDRLLRLRWPGVGFLITVAAIIVIGFLASNIVTRKAFQLLERLFIRAPLVKILYSSMKDLVEAFVGDRKKFNKPVVVRLNSADEVHAVGFITREDLNALALEGHVAVYFPQSYNFAGQLVMVPARNVRPLELDSSKAMAFVVSGGVSGLEGSTTETHTADSHELEK
jgi:uncharacterized membrane protein